MKSSEIDKKCKLWDKSWNDHETSKYDIKCQF